MKEGYKSLTEILLEVAKEEGMSQSEIEDLWAHQKNYIKKQMEKEGVYAIFLPFVGTLSLNVKQFSKEIKYKKKEFYKDFINKVNKLENHENYSEFENAHKKVTGVNRLARYIIRHYRTGIEKSRKLLLHNKCWSVISKYSNGVFEKRDKIIKRKRKND